MSETKEQQKRIDEYLNTVMSMCVDYQLKRAITARTLVSNLRLFATGIERDVLQPALPRTEEKLR